MRLIKIEQITSSIHWVFSKYFIILFGISTFCLAQSATVLWSEDWEGDWFDNWTIEGGTWEVGTPTSGPNGAYNGTDCAATVLNGNYSEPTDTRLVRFTSFTVPSASQNPRLRFWQYFSFSAGDYGEVQIKVGNGSWEPLSDKYWNYSSGVWSQPLISLAAYADSSVQIAFFFHSERWAGVTNNNTGWYVDDVSVIVGQYEFNNPEGFENGIGDWGSQSGSWEVGTPSSDPDSAFNGSNCAATVLDGLYWEPVDAWFASPPFTIPPASQNPRFRFWHWYSFSSGDYGEVFIRLADGSQESISPQFTNTSSGIWSVTSLDLSTYENSSAQILLYFHSERWAGVGNNSTGWYVDDIEITGINNNPKIDSFEAFPLSGISPLSVTFSVQAHDPDGTIFEYRWDFDGDAIIDSVTTNTMISYTYPDVGSFDATCTVVDNGGTTTRSPEVTITVFAETTRIVSVPENTLAAPDATFQIPINISDASGLAGIELKLTFNKNLLEVQGVSPTALTNGFTIADSISNNSGYVAIAGAQATGLPGSSSGALFNVAFKVKSAAQNGDTAFVKFDAVTLYDENTNTIAVTNQNGLITITDDPTPASIDISPDSVTLSVDDSTPFSATAEFDGGGSGSVSVDWSFIPVYYTANPGNLITTSGINTTFTAEAPGNGFLRAVHSQSGLRDSTTILVKGIRGDVNIDSLVDVPDAIRTLQMIGTTPDLYPKWAADMDSSGSIVEGDAIQILREFLKVFKSTGFGEAVFSFGDPQFKANREVIIPLQVNKRSDIGGIGLEFTCVQDRFKLLDVIPASTNALVVKKLNNPHSMRISAINLDGLVNETSEILYLRFQATGDEKATPEIDLHTIRLFDYNGKQIEVSRASLQIPTGFILEPNYPNPFNPTTTIAFSLSRDSYAKLTVYDITGAEVRTLFSQPMNAGEHSVKWDGRNQSGSPAASGIYLYRLVVDNGAWQAVRKMLLMK